MALNSTSKKNRKILFILHIPPPVHGAAMMGKYIKDSSRINDSFKTRYINLGTSRSIDDIGKGGFQKTIRFIGLLWEAMVQMIFFRPDKVYLTLTAKGNGFYKDAIVVFLAKMLGGKMIYHFHNKGVQTRQNKPIDHWLYKNVFKNADVILLSEHLYPDTEKYVLHKRVHICPNGIPGQLSPKSEKQNVSKQQSVCLLFLSNLIESKGVFVLLEACKILKEKRLRFKCIFVGGEGDVTVPELNQRIAELGLEDEAIYVGKKYDEEKEEIFQESDIFVLPTYYPNECFPLVLLEAMSAGLPIVTTREGGIPDMVEDGVTGLICESKDKNVLADKLELLINNADLRRKMGEAGNNRYEQYFTLEHFEKRLNSILKTIINEG